MKKLFLFVAIILIISVITLVGCSSSSKLDQDVKKSETTTEENSRAKVRFEGIGTITTETSTEIANLINTNKSSRMVSEKQKWQILVPILTLSLVNRHNL